MAMINRMTVGTVMIIGDRRCSLGGDRHAREGHDREVDRGGYDTNV